jgi:hypothetical protein
VPIIHESASCSVGRWGAWASLLVLLICATAPMAKCQTYQNVPFDPANTTLPVGYYGYDPAAFINGYQDSLERNQQARQKDEFETTAAYQERLKKLDSENPFTSNSFAFSVAPSSVSYDADVQTFNLEFKPDPNPQSATYSYVLLKTGAENGFGATFTVQKSLSFIYKLWVVKTEDPTGCTRPAAVPINEAKPMKSELRAVLVVRPVYPYASVSTDRTEPTFDRPRDETVSTGEIFAKLLSVRFYALSSGRVLGHCP